MVPLDVTQKTMRTSMKVNGYGIRNKGEERILEFCAAMNMIVWNTLFGIKASHLTTYEFGPSKTNVSYCWVRRNQGNFAKNI